MLKKIDEGTAESDKGYRVKLGTERVVYQEGHHAVPIDIGHELDPFCLVVYSDSLVGFYPPFAGESIQSSTRERILERVAEALDFLGVKYRFEKDSGR